MLKQFHFWFFFSDPGLQDAVPISLHGYFAHKRLLSEIDVEKCVQYLNAEKLLVKNRQKNRIFVIKALF